MDDVFNSLPDPPYFAVIFTSRRSPGNLNEYAAVADRMQQLANQQPGFLGMTSVRSPDGLGITVSYWSDAESIVNWRKHAEHRIAQLQGRDVFYDAYRIEICRVERVTEFQRPHSAARVGECG